MVPYNHAKKEHKEESYCKENDWHRSRTRFIHFSQ